MKLYVRAKTKLKITLICCFILFASCKQRSVADENYQYNTKTNLLLNEEETSSTSRINLKVIKTAKTKYKVNDVKKGTKEIKALARRYEGFISDLNFKNTLYRIENNFTIKIPKEHFDTFLDSIHNYISFIDFENISTKDVTEAYFDAESRLKTKCVVKNRYEDILRNKAKTVDDVLNTEEKLRIIQEEIDVTKGKLNYLKNKISYSTIDIELYQEVNFKEKPESYKKSFLSKIKEGFVNGSNIISTILIGVVNIWPILILGIGVLLIYKRRKK